MKVDQNTQEQIIKEINFKIKTYSPVLSIIVKAIFEIENEEFSTRDIHNITNIDFALIRFYLATLCEEEYITTEKIDNKSYIFTKTERITNSMLEDNKFKTFKILLKSKGYDLRELDDALLMFYSNKGSLTINKIKTILTDRDFAEINASNIFIKTNNKITFNEDVFNIFKYLSIAVYNKFDFGTAIRTFNQLGQFNQNDNTVLGVIYADLNGIDIVNTGMIKLFTNLSVAEIRESLNTLTAAGLLSYDSEEKEYYKTNKMSDRAILAISGQIEFVNPQIFRDKMFKEINFTLKRVEMIKKMLPVFVIDKIFTTEQIVKLGFQVPYIQDLTSEMLSKGLLSKVNDKFVSTQKLFEMMV